MLIPEVQKYRVTDELVGVKEIGGIIVFLFV